MRERVPFNVFLDFVHATGLRRLEVVRRFKDHRYDHLTDFYKPLRDAIVGAHVAGRPLSTLDDFLAGLTDERKRRIFPSLVNNYRAWFQRTVPVWFQPSHTVLPIGDLEVDVAPPLGFTVAGNEHFLNLRFDMAPLPAARAQTETSLMMLALSPTRPGSRFGILDIARGKLHVDQASALSRRPRMSVLLRGEAAAFLTMYEAV